MTTPPLLLAMARYASLADRDLLDDVNVETARAYTVAVTLLAEPLRADDEAPFVELSGAHLWARTESPRDVEADAARRLAFLVGLCVAYHLLRG